MKVFSVFCTLAIISMNSEFFLSAFAFSFLWMVNSLHLHANLCESMVVDIEFYGKWLIV